MNRVIQTWQPVYFTALVYVTNNTLASIAQHSSLINVTILQQTTGKRPEL